MRTSQQQARFIGQFRNHSCGLRRQGLHTAFHARHRQAGQRLLLFSLLVLSTVAFGRPSLSKDIERFQTLSRWVTETGTPRVLDRVPIREGITAARMRVIARTADEPRLNVQHVMCVGEAPRHRKFVFFILTDPGDNSSTIWRASTEGKLLSTLC